MFFKGTCNTNVFNTCIKKVLLPELRPGQIVVLDNASFHKSVRTKELLESIVCGLLFLPPYSPNLNPIEKFWATLKAKNRCSTPHYHFLSNPINSAFNTTC